MARKIVCALLLIGAIVGIERFSYSQTKGFSVDKIGADFAAAEQWATPPLSQAEETLLQQPFRLIACGAECYAFLSEDGQYILKAFKMHRARSIFFRRSFHDAKDKLALLLNPKLWVEKALQMREKTLKGTFDSCSIAYHTLKEETGLIALHLNPTAPTGKTLELVDRLGTSHRVFLDATRFILQQRADHIYPRLQTLIAQGDLDGAKACLDSLVALLRTRYQKGIADRDPVIKTNYGLIGNRAIEIDLGSFSHNPLLKQPHFTARQLRFETQDLALWLHTQSHELAQYFDAQVGFGNPPSPTIYSYLGSGEQFTAYLSADGKTVLKIANPLPESTVQALLKSAYLAFERLQDKSGLLEIHPPQRKSTYPVRLRNRWGLVRHANLGPTLFLLQKKADPLFPTLEAHLRRGDEEGAKQKISSILSLLSYCSSLGIADTDNGMRRNLGFLGKEAVFIDVGSFLENPALADPRLAQQELETKSRRLFRWLRKHHPSLLPFFQAQLLETQNAKSRFLNSATDVY